MSAFFHWYRQPDAGKSYWVTLGLSVLLSLCALSLAGATTYVVDPAGNDDNPGTAAQPWHTMQKAADVAIAGDLVRVQPGTYNESVVVKNSGTKDHPIVFQSSRYRQAIISGKQTGASRLFGPVGAMTEWTTAYVTLRGFVFEHAAGPTDWAEAVTLGNGWRLEDCAVQHNGGDGIGIRGNDVTVLRTITQENGMNGLSGSGWHMPIDERLHNATVQQCITRRNNQLPELPGGNCGGAKFLSTDHLRIQDNISYDNYGSGWWLDWDNSNFVIAGNTFFGNHAGKFQYPRKDRAEYGQIRDESWSGVGFWTEGNPGPGLIENNTIFSVMASGIGVLESGFKAPITVRGNLIADCAVGIDLRAMSRGEHVLGQVIVEDNRIKDWRDEAISSSLEDTIKQVAKPGDMGIVIDHNTYDPGASRHFLHWNTTHTSSLEEAQRVLGAEQHGTVAPIAFKPAYITLKKSALGDFGNPSKMFQVHSLETEQISIDQAIATARATVGSTLVIPVFGRLAITSTNGKASTEVYDLQARFVQITFRNNDVLKRIEEGVTPYAMIIPTYVKVKITRLQQYAIDATALGMAH